MAPAELHRRKLDFTDWPQVLTDIDRLRQAGYDRAGNWDLSQILEHVGEGLRTARQGNSHQGPWIVRKLIGPILLKGIFKSRRMRAGLKVPKWWLPGPAYDESAAVEKFRADLSAFQTMTATPKPHPFLGTLTKSQWNELALIHAGHHLSFLVPRG